MGSSSSGNSVTRVEPPSYQLPYLQTGLQGAQNLYRQGSPVVPFAPQTEAALAGTTQRAIAGSPVTGAAQNYATTALNGGFLGSNPYLDATFNQAADRTQNRLASEFARSGRNVGASEGLRSQQLNDLATSIYGGNYQFERGLQNSLVPQAAGLANQDYVDLAQLQGVGQTVEGLAGQYANAPGQNLDQFLGRVRGTDYGRNEITPQYRNRAGNALGGAMLGSFLGPWGALGGGVLGGIFG